MDKLSKKKIIKSFVFFVCLLMVFLNDVKIKHVNAAAIKPELHYVEYEIRAPFMKLFEVTLENPIEKELKLKEKLQKEAENKETYQYVAIGNSLTWHESGTGFWWNECGMAASCPENDFVHKVAEGIDESKNVKTDFKAVSAKKWETDVVNRSTYLCEMDPYLNNDTDLITIQLGDNATDNFETDYETLVTYVQSKAPNARIILIGLYMTGGEKDAYIPNVANRLGLTYISLDDIRNNDMYHNQIGSVVYDPYGAPHKINLPEVAFHPNDLGMECIAEKILEVL